MSGGRIREQRGLALRDASRLRARSEPQRRAAWKLPLIAGAVLILGVLSSAPASVKNPVSEEDLARRTMAHLARGEFDAVARLVHVPESYSQERRVEDVEAVAKSLRFLLSRLGAISSVEPLVEQEEFYFVATGGGDVPYWESISPYGRAEFPFAVEFANHGRGMVKPVVFMDGERPGRELVAVELGLPVSSRESKETMVDLSVDMFEFMAVPTPPNIRELVEQGMGRAFVRPREPSSTE